MAMRARAHRGTPIGAPTAGYTLLELLVVLGILIALCGISAAVYAKLRTSWLLPAAASQVASILRAARNYSLSSGLPSRVFLEPALGRVTAFGYELVAGFHFEDVPSGGGDDGPQGIPEGTAIRGAFNERGTILGEVHAAPGHVGRGLDFVDRGAAVATPYRPSYFSPRGFSLEAWVLFDLPPPPAKQKAPKRSKKGAWSDPRRNDFYAVLALRGCYELGLLGDGSVYVVAGDEEKEHCLAWTRAGEVVPRRWTHLRASFDGLRLEIEVDGISRWWCPRDYELIAEEDWPPLPAALVEPDADSYLTVSRPDRIFRGFIDEPKVRVALPPRTYDLEAEIRLLGEATTIHFDSRGCLDPEHHNTLVTVRRADRRADGEEAAPAGVTGTTGTATDSAPAPAPGARDSAAADERREAADVLEAMAEYLRKRNESENAEAAAASALPASAAAAGAEAAARGRIEKIIVDPMGTIRRQGPSSTDERLEPQQAPEPGGASGGTEPRSVPRSERRAARAAG